MSKLTFEQKEAAKEQKERLEVEQGGLCYYCGKPWTSSDPPEASHIIIRKYEFEYGYEIINHALNVPICHKTCNQKVILSPYKQSGKDHIQKIRETIKNEK